MKIKNAKTLIALYLFPSKARAVIVRFLLRILRRIERWQWEIDSLEAMERRRRFNHG